MITDIERHPAVIAWQELNSSNGVIRDVVRIPTFRQTREVFRIVGGGPRGTNVIAKRNADDRIAHERLIYKDVLPQLPVPSIECYGAVPISGTNDSWIFLEDAGGHDFDRYRNSHRVLLGAWLGLLHASAAETAILDSISLPCRDSITFYWGHLCTAINLLSAAIDSGALRSNDAKLIGDVIEALQRSCARWDELVSLTQLAPPTLIHADLAPNNMKVRAQNEREFIVAFDWERSAKGLPIHDLVFLIAAFDMTRVESDPGLTAYWSVMQRFWGPLLSNDSAQRFPWIARLFFTIHCIAKDAPCLQSEWPESALGRMHYYYEDLAMVMTELRWNS